MQTFAELSTLERSILTAAAQVDGLTIEEWLAPMLERGEDLSARARAVVGYPATLTAEDLTATEEAAQKAETERESKRLADDEALAYAEYEAQKAKESAAT